MGTPEDITQAASHYAWNLLFQVEGGLAKAPDGPVIAEVPDHAPSGWAGRHGPGIDWKHWPRSSTTGLPMMHVLTLWLPEPYRRQGEQYPGIAFFAGEGQFADGDPVQGDATSNDAFLRDLAEAQEHPGLRRRRDIIDGEFALMWLSEAELAAGPTPPQADLREPGTFVDESEGCGAWDQLDWAEPVDVCNVWLLPRVDPNAGLAPHDVMFGETAENGYVSPYVKGADMTVWAEPLQGMSHLGGTALPVQGMPDGLTPWYLELEEIVELNFGGGNAQIDLESEVFDWAC